MGPFTSVIVPKYEGIDPNYVKINKINMFLMDLGSLNNNISHLELYKYC